MRDLSAPSFALALVLALGLAAPALAQSKAPTAGQAQTAALAASADVKAIEAYLNNLKTLRARFVQTDHQGRQLAGTFSLKRPGRMRFEYDAIKDFIVADGTFVHYYDAKMKQQSTAPIGRTLANFFLRNDIGISKDLQIDDLQRNGNLLVLTLSQAKNPLDGALSLGFTVAEDNSLSLTQWRVLDPQGIVTDVALTEVQTGIKLGNDMFHYYDPQQKKPKYN